MRAVLAVLLCGACSFDTGAEAYQAAGLDADPVRDSAAPPVDAAPLDAPPPAPDARPPDAATPPPVDAAPLDAEPGPCSPLWQDCEAGEACYVRGAETSCAELQPETRPEGDSCIIMTQCEPGTGCVTTALGFSICSTYCDYLAPDQCGPDRACVLILGNSTFGYCKSELWD